MTSKTDQPIAPGGLRTVQPPPVPTTNPADYVIETVESTELELIVTDKPVIPSWLWRTALHDADVWTGEQFEDPWLGPDLGDRVRVVVGDNLLHQIRSLGNPMNSYALGDLVTGVVVRPWSGGLANLQIFLDGGKVLWATSIGYSRPVLQGEDPEEANIGNPSPPPLLHCNGDTWHFLHEPTELLPEFEVDDDEPTPEDELAAARREINTMRTQRHEDRVLLTALCDPTSIVSSGRLDSHPESEWFVVVSIDGSTAEVRLGFDSDAAKALGLAPN